MASRNPFRWSKGKLFLYLIGCLFAWFVLAQLSQNVANGYICSAWAAVYAVFFALLLAFKFRRDYDAATDNRARQMQQRLPIPPQKTSSGSNGLKVPQPLNRDS